MRFRESVILDEVVDRWLVAVAALVSVYVTFRGHNAPGGGFAGGLILGAAFVLQYLTGREPEIRGRAIRQPTGLLGAGLLLALATTVAPLAVGGAPLESHIWKLDIPVVGDLKLVSSTFFDLGVYLIVVATVLMVLLSLGTGATSLDGDEGGEAR
jgi:multicomponent Na+:H+ antiporter subunit A